MIQLRPIRPDEFKDYQEYFVADYAAEIHSNYDTPILEAQHRAQAELDEAFPNGVPIANHFLMAIYTVTENASQIVPQRVGFLWYELSAMEQRCFILDFYIEPAQRSTGFGAAAMASLETEMLSLGIFKIQLRVANDNPRALALYQRLGFSITGINLAKNLKAGVRKEG